MQTHTTRVYFASVTVLTAVVLLLLTTSATHAAPTGTIQSGTNLGFAWSNQAGWVNFGTVGGNVTITDTGITGYAWNNNYGWINLAPTTGGVFIAADGSLSGYAWGAGLGWINFAGVSITETGVFTGQATGTAIGILTFDCEHCTVTTDYVPSAFRADDSDTGGGSGSQSTRPRNVAAGEEGPPLHIPDSLPINIEPDTPVPAPVREEPEDTTVRTTAESDTASHEPVDQRDQLPAQLFDINLEIQDRVVRAVSDLDARLIFVSFGTEPTPVAVTFRILNEVGAEVYRYKEENVAIVVETEGVLRHQFDGVTLPPGEYTLVAETLYDTTVSDEFTASFTVRSERAHPIIWLALGGLLIVLGLGIRARIFFRRKRGDTNASTS